MATFKAFKVVSALPTPLAADAVYAVRVGEGFDLYITDATGLLPYKINQSSAYTVAVVGKNKTGATISKGTAVMATGTLGAFGIITIAPMDGTTNANAMYLIGVAAADIPNDGEGDVVSIGKIRGIDTTVWNEGEVLWISPTVLGGFTNVEPTLGKLKVPVAFVVTDHHTNGEIMVRVTPLDESRLDEKWIDYVTWSSTAAGAATVSGVSGNVRAYQNGLTVYRFIPEPYNAALDGFWSGYSGGVLSGLIVTRG